uniref:C-type lectin domain-containing protein n=1 Tax=Sus scrofa TaxID=9823 RepID=A0A8D1SM85_PIG
MSEEVTYADLKFQDSGKKENTQEFGNFGIKVPPAPPRAWRQRALVLTLLCVLLLIGLGVLGGILVEKLNKLQNFNEELQRNVSLQLIHDMNSAKKIGNLSITLQEIATKLCHQLSIEKPEHKCKPCPKNWMWHEDSCYIVIKLSETWQKSDMLCSAQNASLLKIKNKSVLEFIKSRKIYASWLGLSPRKNHTVSRKLDETIISSDWFTRNTNDLNDSMYCGYLYNNRVNYADCTETKRIICEKLADPMKIEDILTSEEPAGRM